MPDRYATEIVVCNGGLDKSTESLTLGTVATGSATTLQNMEPSIEGGYRRIDGFAKWDSAEVPGEQANDAPILGVKAARGGVFAARLNDAEAAVDIFFSSGSGWGTKLTQNVTTLSSSSTKFRLFSYYLGSDEIVIALNGIDPAWRYDGSTDSAISGTGAPATPKYAEHFNGRLVLAPASATSSFALSESGDDDDFDGVSGALEFNVGDKIVGLKVFRDILYVFCEDSIFKLVGNTTADFQILPVTNSISCLSHDTIQEVGGDIIFLAPDGLRSLAATERIGDVDLGLLSKKIQPLFSDFIGSLTEDKYSSCPIRAKSQYRLLLNESLEDGGARGFLGRLSNTEQGLQYEWSTLLGMNVYCADSEYNADDEVSVFGHPTDGFVYRMETGDSFDNANIAAIYESPQLTLQNATLRKIMRKVDIYTKIEGSNEPTLKFIYDFNDDTVKQPPTIQLATSGDTAKYGAAVYDTDKYSISLTPIFKKNIQGSGFTVGVNISSTGTDSSYTIDSYQLLFTPKGVKR